MPEPVKRLECVRCGRSINPLLVRYLWVGWGERGACHFGERGNTVFGREREQNGVVLCGPCGDQWTQAHKYFVLGRQQFAQLDDFADRGLVRD